VSNGIFVAPWVPFEPFVAEGAIVISVSSIMYFTTPNFNYGREIEEAGPMNPSYTLIGFAITFSTKAEELPRIIDEATAVSTARSHPDPNYPRVRIRDSHLGGAYRK
jgi:hypothetical protein